ncbi:hypothetical protein [uncultured Christiangramia sp.]|uniref:FKBP-type peptidyl-prolyl cis-trans isomerase n=1 Tax=uncultured Christiangramia sp. TaxID=503836 RepID=UPI0026079CA8|nr:hypothetical protein [uncultured Christiangramia sp.]
MRINKLMLVGLTAFLAFACNNDDDGGLARVEVRDRTEVAVEDDQALLEYLSTHFYNYEDFESPSEDFNYQILFDTIAGENADKEPIINSDKLITKIVNHEGVDQNLYVLKVREGAGAKPTFADSTFVTYEGELLTGTVFDSNLRNPVWFNLSPYFGIVDNRVTPLGGVIKGFQAGLTEFGAATGFEVNADNSVEWNNDYGIGAIFMPSGLAYYFNSPETIPVYSPLVFQISSYVVNQADHDNDGIPSFMEDLDGDNDVTTDDSDEDGLPNLSDPDDDGDGTPTRDEVEITEDGTLILTDSDNDGTPDYLDPDVFQ